MRSRSIPILALLTLTQWQLSCSDEGLSLPCGTPAIVFNLQDGCGFGFRLNDGRRLMPVLEGCEDIFADYRHEGLPVFIGFEQRNDLINCCNNAINVRILCLETAGDSR